MDSRQLIVPPPISMEYAYECQKERTSYYWNQPLEYRTTLGVTFYKDVHLLPALGGRFGFGLGGLLTKDLREIKAANMLLGKQVVFGGGYKFDPKSANSVDAEVIYCGHFEQHWGHFLVDSLNRLWYAYVRPDLPIAFSLKNGLEGFTLPPDMRRFFELAEIDPARLIFINKPAFFKSVAVPEQAYNMCSYFSAQYLNTFKIAVSHIKPDVTTDNRKIYFSRTYFNSSHPREVGNEIIDGAFNLAGYEKIYPECVSLDNEVYYLTHAEQYAAVQGTPIHNLVFCFESKPEVFLINKDSVVLPAIFDFCKLGSSKLSVCDFFVAKFPVRHAMGPMQLACNANMKAFLGSLNIPVPNYAPFDKATFIKDSLTYDSMFYTNVKKGIKVPVSTDRLNPYYFPSELLEDYINNWLPDLCDTYLNGIELLKRQAHA